jgi:hypothetical protein
MRFDLLPCDFILDRILTRYVVHLIVKVAFGLNDMSTCPTWGY